MPRNKLKDQNNFSVFVFIFCKFTDELESMERKMTLERNLLASQLHSQLH